MASAGKRACRRRLGMPLRESNAAAPACVEPLGVKGLTACSAELCALSGSFGGAAHGVVVADSGREQCGRLHLRTARERDTIARAGIGSFVLVEQQGQMD